MKVGCLVCFITRNSFLLKDLSKKDKGDHKQLNLKESTFKYHFGEEVGFICFLDPINFLTDPV